MLPLVDQQIIMTTVPFITSFFNWLFVNEHITIGEIISLILCFVVIAVVLKLNCVTNENIIEEGERDISVFATTGLMYFLGCISVAGQAVGTGFVSVISRMLQKEHYLFLSFYTFLFFTIVASAVLICEAASSAMRHQTSRTM